MRIVIAIMLALSIVGLQGGATSSAEDKCRYVFKTGEGLVDSCTGEKARNSNPRGGGPAIVTLPPCHMSYTLCLKYDVGDYDCADGTGNGPNYVYWQLRVVGPDEFGLDDDLDGLGCEMLPPFP